MTAHLLAADPNRRPPRNGDERPACSTCSATARRCDTGFWLRGGYCCPDCDGHATREETPTDA